MVEGGTGAVGKKSSLYCFEAVAVVPEFGSACSQNVTWAFCMELAQFSLHKPSCYLQFSLALVWLYLFLALFSEVGCSAPSYPLIPGQRQPWRIRFLTWNMLSSPQSPRERKDHSMWRNWEMLAWSSIQKGSLGNITALQHPKSGSWGENTQCPGIAL